MTIRNLYISKTITGVHNEQQRKPYQINYCNLHLEFKRLDLLKEFNRIANDGSALKSGHIF